jgi:hypothetical protein
MHGLGNGAVISFVARAIWEEWESALRQKYEEEMIHKLDTHSYVGTVHKHPKESIIMGLFFPPKRLSGTYSIKPATEAVKTDQHRG